MASPRADERYLHHFTDPLYDNNYLDTAPFGSDEGADLLAEVELGRRTIEAGDRIDSIIPSQVIDLFLAAAEAGDPDGLFEIYAAGFLLLRFTGRLDEPDYRLLRRALVRLASEPDMEAVLLRVIHDLDSFMSA